MIIYYFKENQIFFQNHMREEAVYQSSNNALSIQQLAQYYLVDYEAARRLIARKFNFVQKTPVMLVHNYCLMFPTLSPQHQECVWLNYYAIDCIKDLGNHHVGIYFKRRIDHFHFPSIKNDECLVIDGDIRGIRTQMKRCKVLHETLLHHRHILNLT